jgi:hypothetical protein
MVRQRHLEMGELLALRDGEGSAFARSHLVACGACRRELNRLYAIRAELRALPTFSPPRELWPRVADHVGRRRLWRRLSYGTLGLAAAAVLAGFIALRGPAAVNEEPADVWVSERVTQDLGPVIRRSRALESLLQTHRPMYQVYDAPTALAVSVLEDRVILLDRLLEESRSIGADRAVLRNLWVERNETLETLVGLQLVQENEPVWR